MHRIDRKTACLVALLGICSFGFTDCDNFVDVTVPSSDTSPPAVFAGDWYGGRYSVWDINDEIHIEIDDPAESHPLVGSALDSGGVKRLRVTWEWEAVCCTRNETACTRADMRRRVYEDSQGGGVGSRVKNGIFGYELFSPNYALSQLCPSGYRDPDASLVWARWRTEGWNYHNRKRTSGWSTAWYGTITLNIP